ncbi:glycosyltransferase [Limosilactobacillus pontis]|uniref:Glycosyltransferase n=1 Tax=Limosilactobacillus pontis TaxID=35787 RepID=A0ABU7SU39_9LACO
MIFVTVGTHEQPFNRLIKCLDELKANNIINDSIIIQKGYSTYIPKFCKYYDFLPYDVMDKYVREANIVITHGGPATFLMPLKYNKVPIVVPRQQKFNEHINNHQVKFVKFIEQQNNNIIAVYDINRLGNAIINYKKTIKNMNNGEHSNNEIFNKKFSKIVDGLFH